MQFGDERFTVWIQESRSKRPQSFQSSGSGKIRRECCPGHVGVTGGVHLDGITVVTAVGTSRSSQIGRIRNGAEARLGGIYQMYEGLTIACTSSIESFCYFAGEMDYV